MEIFIATLGFRVNREVIGINGNPLNALREKHFSLGMRKQKVNTLGLTTAQSDSFTTSWLMKMLFRRPNARRVKNTEDTQATITETA
jgi:hypothetical protein